MSESNSNHKNIFARIAIKCFSRLKAVMSRALIAVLRNKLIAVFFLVGLLLILFLPHLITWIELMATGRIATSSDLQKRLLIQQVSEHGRTLRLLHPLDIGRLETSEQPQPQASLKSGRLPLRVQRLQRKRSLEQGSIILKIE